MNVPPGFDEDFGAASDWALEYRKHGIQVVPCANKMPALKTWKQFQSGLAPQHVFDGWYGPGGQFVSLADMGMLTGTASDRILMVDLDLYKPGGELALNWWLGILAVHNNNMELETWEQFTGGGGRQLFFRYPAGWSCANAKTDIHVDIRGQGGFAVLPPTRHASGKQYVWEEGRAPWEIGLLEAPAWLLEEIERLVREHGGGASHGPRTAGNGPDPAGQGSFDGFGRRTDGRDHYMRDLLWAAFTGFRNQSPIPPGSGEKERVWTDYEGHAGPKTKLPDESNADGLEREGRGRSLFEQKWARNLAQWDTEIREAAEERARKEHPDLEGDFAKAQAPGATPFDTYETLSIRDIKAMADPQWLVQGMVVEQSMGFIFGPPGCLKTFIAMGLALSLTTGRPVWWGRQVQRKGAVIYICSEGVKTLKFRVMAWERHFKTSADDAPFRLIRQSIHFTQEGDVLKLLQTVQKVVDEIGPVVAVFVDTVSRVLPGVDENLQKDMTVFIAACDAVRQTFGATVVGLHHTNAAGGFRGSTVMPGAGDFLLEVRREPGAMVGSIYAKKIKDDDDGWEQPFKATKIELPGILARTSLVIDSDAPPEPREGDNKERAPFDMREQILRALDKAWCAGKPWSHASNSPRSGVNMIVQTWPIPRKAAREILDTWLGKGIIEEDTFSTKRRIKGYRKVKEL